MSGQSYHNGRPLELPRDFRPAPGDEGGGGNTLSQILFEDYEALDRFNEAALDNAGLLRAIALYQRNRFSLETLGNAFTPFTVTVGTTPTLLIPPSKNPRGYMVLNPSQTVSGVAVSTNALPNIARAAGTYFSAGLSVGAYRTNRVFMDVTVAPATSLTVDLQTQDPQSGNWSTAQPNIFSGAFAIGTYYADCGEIGCDVTVRLRVVSVGAGNSNFSCTIVNKEAYSSTQAPPAVFLGNQNVNTTIGYPLLGGVREKFLLQDNTPLYAIATAATNVRVFQLQ